LSVQQGNPLAKHFRQPAIHMVLPSKGQFWHEGSLELPATGELPIYPMTTKDEITLRTPDALLNGESVVSVIQSCCPAIKDAWRMPSIDVDAVIMGIRIASYGADMEVSSTCSHCGHSNQNTIDLTLLTSKIQSPDYSRLVESGGLKFKLRPQAYFDVNKNNLIAFQEQQIMRTVNDETLDEMAKMKEFHKHLDKLVEINNDIIANSIDHIITEDGTKVSNREHIVEFIANADNKIVKKIQKKLEEFAEQASLPKMKAKCEECEGEYDVSVVFDYSSFFGQGS
jgi:hypothetical protein